MERRIIHFDMDAFFASIEQRDFPQYVGKPIVVGGLPSERGVVATCSYEARPFGIHSAMPSRTARRLCPDVIFVKPRFSVYREVSAQIKEIFCSYTELVEMLSLDEAYLDLSTEAYDFKTACQLAHQVKRRVLAKTQLTVSAGISYNKFLAKIASDLDKPDGCYLIAPENSLEFIANLAIAKFHGVGKVTQKRMHQMGIQTGADLRACSRDFLIATFGKVGDYYYQVARGNDNRAVVPHRPRKSVGAETTFHHDLIQISEIMPALNQRALEVARILAARHLSGRTVTLKIKYADFRQITRSHTLPQPLSGLREMRRVLNILLDKTEVGRHPVRLLGVSVSNLCHSSVVRQEIIDFSDTNNQGV